jgi:hypothetical protein
MLLWLYKAAQRTVNTWKDGEFGRESVNDTSSCWDNVNSRSFASLHDVYRDALRVPMCEHRADCCFEIAV